MVDIVNKRNANLDVLRHLAMFLVVVWHFYVHGLKIPKVSSADVSGSVGMINLWLSQWVIWISSACVNLFVIISGYFLVSKPFNWKRVTLLWMEVLFYGVGIALLSYIIWPDSFSVRGLFPFFLPITGGTYWFFQQYFGLVCLAPFLSAASNHLDQKQFRRFLFAITLLGCTITLNFPLGTIMGAEKGYGLLWFIFLFFCGGYLKRFPIRMKPLIAIASVVAIGIVGSLFVLLKSMVKSTFLFEVPAYNSFGFFIAVFLFIYLTNKKPLVGRLTKYLSYCSTSIFGVYLIHDHPMVRELVWRRLYDWSSLLESVWLIPVIIVIAIAIYISCILIDLGRAWLFRVAGAEKLATYIGKKGEGFVKLALVQCKSSTTAVKPQCGFC